MRARWDVARYLRSGRLVRVLADHQTPRRTSTPFTPTPPDSKARVRVCRLSGRTLCHQLARARSRQSSTKTVYKTPLTAIIRRMDNSTTSLIAARLTRAIVEHRLQPGTKWPSKSWPTTLACRALVRQALFQLSQNRLVRLEPAERCLWQPLGRRKRARCLPCAACSKMVRLHAPGHPAKLRALRAAREKGRGPGRRATSQLLGDFHSRPR